MSCLDNLIKIETITSVKKTETEYSIEYEFRGDFTNLVAAIPYDLNGPVCETICLHSNKHILYINTLNKLTQPEVAKALIVKLN